MILWHAIELVLRKEEVALNCLIHLLDLAFGVSCLVHQFRTGMGASVLQMPLMLALKSVST